VPQALVKAGGQRSAGVGTVEARKRRQSLAELRRRAYELVSYVERVTGIEPAWPAWKAWDSKRHLGWSASSQADAVPFVCLSAVYGGHVRPVRTG
jgi:hypothetical protein